MTSIGIDPGSKARPLDIPGWQPVAMFCIAGKPVPASRPRVYGHRTTYPAAHLAWEAGAVVRMRQQWRSPPLTGPVRLEMTFVLARPARMTPKDCGGSLSAQGERDLALVVGRDGVRGRIEAYTDRRDVDNLAKLAMDAMQKAKVIENDSRVVELVARKMWAAVTHDAPGVEVSVWRRE